MSTPLHLDPVQFYEQQIIECMGNMHEAAVKTVVKLSGNYFVHKQGSQDLNWDEIVETYKNDMPRLQRTFAGLFQVGEATRHTYSQTLLDILGYLDPGILMGNAVKDLIYGFGCDIEAKTWDTLYANGHGHQVMAQTQGLNNKSLLYHIQHRTGRYRTYDIDNLAAMVFHNTLETTLLEPYENFFEAVGAHGTPHTINRIHALYPDYDVYVVKGAFRQGRLPHEPSFLDTFKLQNPAKVLALCLYAKTHPNEMSNTHFTSDSALPYLHTATMTPERIDTALSLHAVLDDTVLDLSEWLQWSQNYYTDHPILPLALPENVLSENNSSTVKSIETML